MHRTFDWPLRNLTLCPKNHQQNSYGTRVVLSGTLMELYIASLVSGAIPQSRGSLSFVGEGWRQNAVQVEQNSES